MRPLRQMMQGARQRSVGLSLLSVTFRFAIGLYVTLSRQVHMVLELDALALKRIGMRVIAAIATQQYHLLPGFGVPQQPGAKAFGNPGALAGEQGEVMLAIVTDNAVITPEVLAFLLFTRLGVLDALGAREQLRNSLVGQGFNAHWSSFAECSVPPAYDWHKFELRESDALMAA
jgi:hypothetical protein